jgi:hypothetical protein
MANFLDLRTRRAYGILTLAPGSSEEVGLWGGGPNGEDLIIKPNDPSIATISKKSLTFSSDPHVRRFTLHAQRIGNVMIEARLGEGGPVWAYMQLAVADIKVAKTGPRLGHDGSIPTQYVATVTHAIDMAWKLNEDPGFVEAFRDTVSKLSGRKLLSDIYALTLNKTVINLAETSTDTRIAKLIVDEAADIKSGALGGPTPAFSFKDGTNIWIRKFSLDQGVRATVANIFHEGAHLAGAPGDTLAEFALDVIHKKAGFPR